MGPPTKVPGSSRALPLEPLEVQAETRLKRWLALPIGLGLAAIAGYVLLMSGPVEPSALRTPPAHSELGQESKDELLEILREADRDEPFEGETSRPESSGR